MRRHWATVLLFVLAMVVQTLAPAAGVVSVAKAAAPGLSTQGICLTNGLTAGDEKQTPGKSSHHRDLCPLCQSTCDGVAPLVGRMAFNWAAPLGPVRLAWTIGARAPPTPDFDYARQARAPPAIS